MKLSESTTTRNGSRASIHEPARDVPVAYDCDVCVIGGSCTGLFAAVQAARLGATVSVVESMGYFGGTATASLVNVWHTHLDTVFQRTIIAGMSMEVIDRLLHRNAATSREPNEHWQYAFSPAELILELDELALARKGRLRPFLHARFGAAMVDEDRRVTAVAIEDKSGRRAIRAKAFVDASGDADLVRHAGFEAYRGGTLQPPTTCFFMDGLREVQEANPGFGLAKAAFDRSRPGHIREGLLWTAPVPGSPSLTMVAGTRAHGSDCADADELTAAEFEGRRQVRAIRDVVRQNFVCGDKVTVQAIAARTGIRETWRTRCLHQLAEHDVLWGTRYDDAIANGSYRVDIHHTDRPGTVLRYLDGRELHMAPDCGVQEGRWRGPIVDDPTFYQVPYGTLVPRGSRNVLVAGRCIDADDGAFGAIRVMVNTTQMGQAAGAAAVQAVEAGVDVNEVDVSRLRATLERQGACII